MFFNIYLFFLFKYVVLKLIKIYSLVIINMVIMVLMIVIVMMIVMILVVMLFCLSWGLVLLGFGCGFFVEIVKKIEKLKCYIFFLNFVFYNDI